MFKTAFLKFVFVFLFLHGMIAYISQIGSGLGNSEDEQQWNTLFENFMKETNTQEKIKLMYALATTPNTTLLQRFELC